MKKNLQNISIRITLIILLINLTKNVNAQCVSSLYDDFETGLFSAPWLAGTGHTVTVNNSNPAEGVFSMNMTGTSAFYAGPNVQFTSSQPTSIEWWTKTNNTTVANGYFVVGDAATATNNGIVFCYFNSTSQLRFFNTAGYNYPIVVNTWYHIELKNINWTNKTFDIYINSVLWQTAFAFRTPASTDMTQVQLFNLNSATASYDKIVIGAVPPTLTVTSSSSSLCAGSSLTLTASGTSTSYAWSNSVSNGVGFTPTATAIYTVVGTGSNSCQSTATTAVNVNQSPTVTIAASATAICNGLNANLTANGASTYTWNTASNSTSISVNPSSNTNYTVIGTNSVGCTNSSTFSLIVNQNPTITATSNSSIICSGQSASLSANGANTYTWNTASTNTIISVTPSITTNYTVNGSSIAGCTNSFVITQSVSACTDIDQNNKGFAVLSVYPNPASDIVTFESAELQFESNCLIKLNDIIGREVGVYQFKGKINIDFTGLTKGIYIYQLYLNNKPLSNGKLILN